MRTQLFRLRYTSHAAVRTSEMTKTQRCQEKPWTYMKLSGACQTLWKVLTSSLIEHLQRLNVFLLHLVHLHLSRYGCHITSFVTYQPASRKRANTDVKQERRWITSAWVFLWNSSSFIIEISYRNFARYQCWFVSIGRCWCADVGGGHLQLSDRSWV